MVELTAQGDPHDWVAVQMLHASGARSDVTLSCASAIEPSRTEVELYGRERSIAVDARAAARAESFARLRAEFADGRAHRRTPPVRRGARPRAATPRRPGRTRARSGAPVSVVLVLAARLGRAPGAAIGRSATCTSASTGPAA